MHRLHNIQRANATQAAAIARGTSTLAQRNAMASAATHYAMAS